MTLGMAIRRYTVDHLRFPGGALSAPDYFEPVAAWHAWRVRSSRSGLLLAELFGDVTWPPGRPLVCTDFVVGWRLEAIDWEELLALPRASRPIGLGRVLLWGDVIEAENGWLATHAYPQRVFLPARTRGERRRTTKAGKRLADYGAGIGRLDVESHAEVVPRLLRAFPHEAYFRPAREVMVNG